MFLQMCPEGSEGSSYAMLTTISNLAGTLSSSISGEPEKRLSFHHVSNAFAAALANVWDVSNATLRAHRFEGLWRLTLVCGMAQLTGLSFLGLLPANTKDQRFQSRCSSSSATAGSLFVVTMCLSLLFVVVSSSFNLLDK